MHARLLQNPEDVEFWHHSDKEGWLQSQGDKLKTWRRRWHVLKDVLPRPARMADPVRPLMPAGSLETGNVEFVRVCGCG